MMEQFEPLESALTDAVYLAANAAAAQMAYISVIEASGVSNGARLLFEASAYNALYSYFFNPDTDPDLSGFSGDACGAPTECVTLLSEESFTMTKTCDNGNDWTLFEIPSWAVRVEWSITFSDGFNVVWGSGAPGSCEAFPGTVASQGFFASAANEWDHTFGATSYFGVGGFFSGLPNGSTRDVTIHYLRACPAV